MLAQFTYYYVMLMSYDCDALLMYIIFTYVVITLQSIAVFVYLPY